MKKPFPPNANSKGELVGLPKKIESYDSAIVTLEHIIDVQESREDSFFKTLGLTSEQYKDTPVISANILAQKNSKSINQVFSILEDLENRTKALRKEELQRQKEKSKNLILNEDSSEEELTIRIYEAIKKEIVNMIIEIYNNNEKNSTSIIYNAIISHHQALIERANLIKTKNEKDIERKNKRNEVINKSFNKIFAILAEVEKQEKKENLPNSLTSRDLGSYSVSNLKKEISNYQEKMIEKNTKKDSTRLDKQKARLEKENAKILTYTIDGENFYELNIGAITTSVTQSISGITNNLRGGALEKIIQNILQEGKKEEIIKETAIFDFSEVTGAVKVSGGQVKQHHYYDESKKYEEQTEEEKFYSRIKEYKGEALKHARNVKADVVVGNNDTYFGISAKVGQKEGIKLDTRGSFYSFLNFIGHYKHGEAIAEALENPVNVDTILAKMTREGKTVSFSELNKALSVIAYAFFGYFTEDLTLDVSYFISQSSEEAALKYAYQNNTVIITDQGEIKRISPFLKSIKSFLEEEKRQLEHKELLKINFATDSKDKKDSYKQAWNKKDSLEAMRYVSVFTILSQ